MAQNDKQHGGGQGQHKWKLQVENEVYQWDSQFITGAQVRDLGPGIPDSMDLFLKIKGKAGQLVKNADPVDLDAPGIEKFYAQEASSEAGGSGNGSAL
ncbi:multiubiquitin domain-containing protein [Bradyrhizobium ivorense]|uniref:multiubiquitin domain-containing protein n=1 Tax=Bradyrhizobium ivorense TaxID=2511166 RepID=UPI0010B74A9D|nr:multiubiquitin domain-containing protein [Bradyrhizobium ivorense]VIO79183.1 hypothetical protein CI41S_67510 [Bradyrhizobium ivorense]